MKQEKSFETILAICFGLLILHLVFHIKIFLTITVIVSGAGLLSVFLRNNITYIWLKLATGLGFISSKILLTLIFFLILTPIAFLMKVFSKSPVKLKKGNAQSFYTVRKHQYVGNDLENTW